MEDHQDVRGLEHTPYEKTEGTWDIQLEEKVHLEGT